VKSKTKNKKNLHRWALLLGVLFVCFINMDISFAKPSFNEAWNAFMKEYRIVLASISGLGALTSILVFIIHFIKFGANADNPYQRREAIVNMLISAICTALLGGVTLILTLFYSIIFLG